jgi:3-oxoacyl-[acyl-carrier protein] reductase
MDLGISDDWFLVCGASSGFGRAIAVRLLEEQANVIVTARREDKLKELSSSYPDQVVFMAGDLTHSETLDKLVRQAVERSIRGVILNAGGPPASGALETDMEDWDQAYQLVLRWKVELATRLAPLLEEKEWSRMLFIESQSVKQPIPNLVLSNAFRAGVSGFMKTLSGEVAADGLTVNMLAPGSHNTPAIERVIQKKADHQGISYEQARAAQEASIPVGRMGEGEELASLAAWLLSEHSGYVTGQVISHTGGNIQSLFG